MAKKPTEREKWQTMFWDGLAGLIFLVIFFVYRYGVLVHWWEPVNLW